MKLTKKTSPRIILPTIVEYRESNAWRWTAIVMGIFLLLSLCRCSSLPTDVKTLQEENAQLRQALQECESDGKQCMDLLIQCEPGNAK